MRKDEPTFEDLIALQKMFDEQPVPDRAVGWFYDDIDGCEKILYPEGVEYVDKKV